MHDWQGNLATLEDLPKAKRPINTPLYQVHMDTFSSSVKSIGGYNHVIVFVDAATGSYYRWIYGIKTKDNTIKVLQTLQIYDKTSIGGNDARQYF